VSAKQSPVLLTSEATDADVREMSLTRISTLCCCSIDHGSINWWICSMAYKQSTMSRQRLKCHSQTD